MAARVCAARTRRRVLTNARTRLLQMMGVSIPLNLVCVHSGTLRSDKPLVIESDPLQWSYAASVKLETLAADGQSEQCAFAVTVNVDVRSGELGCLLVEGDWATVAGAIPPGKGPGRHAVHLLCEAGERDTRLVFRNNAPGNQPSTFAIEGIEVSVASPRAAGSRIDTVCDVESETIDVARLQTAVSISGSAASGRIDIVTVERLQQRLGFKEALDYPEESRQKPFSRWRMEVDDAPILRYLYRGFRPRRHLEFGTWQGFGACLCLSECDATVWTINLPQGELIAGAPAYSSVESDVPPYASPLAGADPSVYQTDAGIFIGHQYRAAGFGHRVCQVYCDSREWDTTAYPPGFFDSVLIDGGHAPDVVISDTRKALQLVRPGGLLLWHDFCPDPEILESSPASAGVVAALTGHWHEIRGEMRDLFWIQPSFLLVGIR